KAEEVLCREQPALLAPGAAITCRLARAVQLEDLAAGKAPIELAARGRDPAGGKVAAEAARASVPATRADLVTIVSMPEGDPREGEPLTLQVSVRNGGPEAVSGVELSVVLPAELAYRAHRGEGRFEAPRWRVGRLAAGEERVLAL